MTTRAVFVGVNKHLDPAIPELSGASRDATALWALFTDTVQGLTARLLVDDVALMWKCRKVSSAHLRRRPATMSS
jgi:helicase